MSKQPKILLLGGTGRVGQQVLASLLSSNYQVTAIIRDPSTSTLKPHTNLTLIPDTPTSPTTILTALTSLLPSPITIISTLGHSRTNPSNPYSTPTSPALYISRTMGVLIDTLNSHPELNASVAKLIVLSAFGAGDSYVNLPYLLRFVMWSARSMRMMLEDHDAVIGALGNEGGVLDGRVLVVRPVMLKFNGEGEEPWVRVSEDAGRGLGMLKGCDVGSLSGWIAKRVEGAEVGMPVVYT